MFWTRNIYDDLYNSHAVIYIKPNFYTYATRELKEKKKNTKIRRDQSPELAFSDDGLSHSSRSVTKWCSGALIDGNMTRLGTTGLGLDPPASGSRLDPSLTTGRSVLTLPPTDDILSFHILPSYQTNNKIRNLLNLKRNSN
jgi:hypothetical protein